MHQNALGIGDLWIDFKDVLHSTVLAKSWIATKVCACFIRFHVSKINQSKSTAL